MPEHKQEKQHTITQKAKMMKMRMQVQLLTQLGFFIHRLFMFVCFLFQSSHYMSIDCNNL